MITKNTNMSCTKWRPYERPNEIAEDKQVAVMITVIGAPICMDC